MEERDYINNTFDNLPNDEYKVSRRKIKSKNTYAKKHVPERQNQSTQSHQKHDDNNMLNNNPINIQKEHIPLEDAEKITFKNKWVVWIHPNSSDDWTLKGYTKIMEIENIADFWSFMNNFKILNYMDHQFFVMRDGITPLWEDIHNKNGGASSLRISAFSENLLDIWELMCLLTVNENICSDSDDINGISFNLKRDLTVIKLWNKNEFNDITNKISGILTTKYKCRFKYIRNRATN